MSNEEKRAELKKFISDTVDESIKRVLSPVTIPKGYLRCPDCGTLIKENAPCLYCVNKEEPEEPEEFDAIDELLG